MFRNELILKSSQRAELAAATIAHRTDWSLIELAADDIVLQSNIVRFYESFSLLCVAHSGI